MYVLTLSGSFSLCECSNSEVIITIFMLMHIDRICTELPFCILRGQRWNFYAPNFEIVEGAYCFGLVRPSF